MFEPFSVARARTDFQLRIMAEDESSELNFEAALDRLEALVESMEDGEIPLSALVDKFEEGSSLIKQCEARLRAAELKIQQLRETGDGTTLDPVDPDSLSS